MKPKQRTRFRSWMSEHSLTDASVARTLEIHRVTVAKWKAGAAQPRGLYAKALKARWPDCPILVLLAATLLG